MNPQFWRDLSSRLGLTGRSPPGSGDDPGRPRLDISDLRVFGAAIVAATLLWFVSGLFIVREGHRAVVTTFGTIQTEVGPGLNWRWPAPIQKHDTVDMLQIRTEEIGFRGTVRAKNTKESLMLTADENIIDVQFVVQYTLSNASDWLFNHRETTDTVRQISESAVREVVGKTSMNFALYEGREKIAYDTHLLAQATLTRYKLGVKIANVTVLAVQPPEQVQNSFDDAVRAGQDRARARSEGEAYANDVVPRSHGAAARLRQDAEAYKAAVVEEATGNAARFVQVAAEYQKAPAVTRDRMHIDAMQNILVNSKKVLVQNNAANSVMQVPIAELASRSVQGHATPIPAGSPSPKQPKVPGAQR